MSDHSQRAHSKFGASGAHRWFPCPGSVRLTENLPETESPYAKEGTQAHELLEALIRVELPGATGRDLNDAAGHFGQAPSSMVTAVFIARDYVLDILAAYPDAVVLQEHKFEIPSVVAPGQVFGTNDIVIYIPSMRLLYVIDYKHGVGEYVAVKGNKQLRFYGLGALTENPHWVVDTVALVIVQPRIEWAAPIREDWVPVQEILDFSAEIEVHVAAALEPDAPLAPGEAQCRWCGAAVSCPARMRQALEMVGTTFGHIQEVTAERLQSPDEMTPDRIGHVLNLWDQVENWVKAVAKRGMELELAGTHIPGRKLVEAQAKRRYNLPEEPLESDVQLLAENLARCAPGLDASQFLEPKVVGITEAERVVKAAARAAVPKPEGKKAVEDAVARMALLTTKKSSGNLSLVPEDDGRPAVQRAAAAFSGVALPHIADGEQR